MDSIGILSPEQARALWQDYLTRKQLAPQVTQNFPQRRQIDEVSPHRVFVKNTSGEEIPAYACLQVTGTEEVGGRTAIKVEKPDSTTGEYLFNSQYAIATDSVGWAYRFGVVVMLGDGETPTAANVQYSPVADEWFIEEGSGPFVVFGEHVDAEDGLIGRFAGGGNQVHGIVVSSLGRGYYRVRLSTWSGTTPDDTEDTLCEILAAQTEGTGGISDCGVTHTLPTFTETSPTHDAVTRQTTEKSPTVTVLAYHRASIRVPLELWTDVLMSDLGDTNVVAGSDPEETEKCYQIDDGLQKHLALTEEEWDCCGGVDTLLSRKVYVIPGIECSEETCEECEE